MDCLQAIITTMSLPSNAFVSRLSFICCYTKSQIKSLSTSSKPQRVWINTQVVGRSVSLKGICTHRERKPSGETQHL